MEKKFGIDLSKWQKGFDFKEASKEVKFCILRAKYHYTTDACFENFYKECKKYHIPVGCYIYTLAKNTYEAIHEAQLLCDLLKGKQFEYPIYIDIEDVIYKSRTKKENTEIVKAFCTYMEKQGYFVGVYSFDSFFTNNLNNAELNCYSRWVAKWTKDIDVKYPFDIWQFGGETNYKRTKRVSNFAVVDQSYCYRDLPTIIMNARLNGFNNLPVDGIQFHFTYRK